MHGVPPPFTVCADSFLQLYTQCMVQLYRRYPIGRGSITVSYARPLALGPRGFAIASGTFTLLLGHAGLNGTQRAGSTGHKCQPAACTSAPLHAKHTRDTVPTHTHTLTRHVNHTHSLSRPHSRPQHESHATATRAHGTHSRTRSDTHRRAPPHIASPHRAGCAGAPSRSRRLATTARVASRTNAHTPHGGAWPFVATAAQLGERRGV